MKRNKIFLILLWGVVSCNSWKEPAVMSDLGPEIFPDYKGVTIPCNIAPLNFMIEGADRIQAVLSCGDTEVRVVGKNGVVQIPLRKWQGLLDVAEGDVIGISVASWSKDYPEGVSYAPFGINVSSDTVDPYVSYRLIEPGYEGWRQVGIFQRDLSSFDESAVVTNRESNTTCINCHNYPAYSPESMMFHARGANGGTILYDGGVLRKIDFKSIGPKVNTAYPAWHPGGRYIAFSSNTTFQAFYGEGEQPVEVYDTASDLVLYDIHTGEVLTDDRFLESEPLESFPSWSADGKYLYYVAARKKILPAEVTSVQYSIFRVSFDEQTGSLGEDIQVVYDAEADGGSASFPRVSPDGRYLLYTWSEYGTFPIWHDEADLKMIDLATGQHADVSVWNDGSETDSYHSWSSDGRWVVFSSRRIDGRYTRLYLACLDSEGVPGKPFLLPQEDPRQNLWRLKSYNVPEFTSGKIQLPKEAADLFYSED